MARVLVVDDEAFVRQLLRTYLERAGHLVMEAANGRDALDTFTREQPDLVVTDNTMPELSGADLIRELRRTAPEARIIAMSGFPYQEGLTNVDRLLPKPFTREQFIKTVDDVLKT